MKGHANPMTVKQAKVRAERADARDRLAKSLLVEHIPTVSVIAWSSEWNQSSVERGTDEARCEADALDGGVCRVRLNADGTCDAVEYHAMLAVR